MGAYSPAPIISKVQLSKICEEIIEPTINQLIKKNIDYRGVLYFGLMITDSGPKVIEYNCRFGDPECQTIMPLIDNNFATILHKCSMGKLEGIEKISSTNKVSGCVIAASDGYPEKYEIGYPIKYKQTYLDDQQIFHSGTAINEAGETVTNGGRVLSIVSQADTFDNAFKYAYESLSKINFKGIYYRKDIGYQVRSNIKGEEI